MKVGDIVKYMSRLVLLVEMSSDPDWVYGIELGEKEITKYRKTALRSIQ